jgi:phosphohistidine phosphatase
MEVYLLRHGVAVDHGTPGYTEEDRPLTADGIDKMKRGAHGIASLVDDFDLIISSPLVRARETAQLVANATRYTVQLTIARELLPSANVRDTLALVQTHRVCRRLLLTGHEPHLSGFATFLLGGTSSVIEFKKGALCRIDLMPSAPREPGTLIYLLPPKVLRALGGRNSHPSQT